MEPPATDKTELIKTCPNGNQKDPRGAVGSLRLKFPETTPNITETTPSKEGREMVGEGRGKKRPATDLEEGEVQPPNQKMSRWRRAQKGSGPKGEEKDTESNEREEEKEK